MWKNSKIGPLKASCFISSLILTILSTSAGCEPDDIIYLHSSLLYIGAEFHSGGNVLCEVRKKIWAPMCLIVLLLFPDGYGNFILITSSSCLKATEFKELQIYILMFYIVSFFLFFFLKCLDVIWTSLGLNMNPLPLALFQSGTLWGTIMRDMI